MKIFIVFTVLALLFVIGSALALTAIGRNAPTKKQKGEQEKSGKGDKE